MAAALTVAACGSSSTKSSASSTGTATAAAATGHSAGGCGSAVNSVIKTAGTLSQYHPSKVAGTVNMSSLKGKSVWDVDDDLAVPADPKIASGFSAAARSVGLVPHVFDGKGNVSTIAQGIQEAVNQKAAGIVLDAVPPALVSSAVQSARAAGIPVVDSTVYSPTDRLHRLDQASITLPYESMGKWAAAYALQSMNCKGDVAIFTSSDLPQIADIANGAKAFISSACPSCKAIVEDVPVTQLVTGVGPITSTLVTKYPSLGAVIAPDAQLYNIIPAIQSAGAASRVHAIGSYGDVADVPLLRKGNEGADVVAAPYQYLGWMAVDELGRLADHMSPVPENAPAAVLTSGSVSADSTAQLESKFGNYVKAFGAAWKQ